MDWTRYEERRKRHDRWIVAALCTGVIVSLLVLATCAVVIARVS